jgi:hypothetical protein
VSVYSTTDCNIVADGGCTASVGALPPYYSASASLKVVQQLEVTALFYVGSFHTTCARWEIQKLTKAGVGNIVYLKSSLLKLFSNEISSFFE